MFENRLKTYLFRRCYETVSLSVTFPFPSHYLPPHNSGPWNSFYCLGHFKNVYDDDDERPVFRDYPGEPVPEGNTNVDFTEARDSEWQWHQLGHMQVCTSLQTDNHASTPPLSFLQAGCPSCRPTNSVKALKAKHKELYPGFSLNQCSCLQCSDTVGWESERASGL